MITVLIYDSNKGETIDNVVSTTVSEVTVTTPPGEGSRPVLKYIYGDTEYFAEQNDSEEWVSDIGTMKTISG